jgi:hypothetical protein
MVKAARPALEADRVKRPTLKGVQCRVKVVEAAQVVAVNGVVVAKEPEPVKAWAAVGVVWAVAALTFRTCWKGCPPRPSQN